jgi:hypothetical protein
VAIKIKICQSINTVKLLPDVPAKITLSADDKSVCLGLKTFGENVIEK